MTAPINPNPALQTQLNPLKRMTKFELEKIQKKIAAIATPDPLVHEIAQWKERLVKKMDTNGELHSIICKCVEELLPLLHSTPLLAPPIRKIDERHALLETVIHFMQLYIQLPENLTAAAKRIQRVRNFIPLTEEQRREIDAIRARKTAEAEEMARLAAAAKTPKIHTFKEFELKAEQEAQLRLRQISELEKQFKPLDVKELLTAIRELEKGNHNIQQRLGEAHRAISVLDRLQNPFRPVQEGEVVVNAAPEVLNSAMRRQLRAELMLLSHVIKDWGIEDTMTVKIQKWGDDFFECLKEMIPENLICKEYIKVVQEILIDPIFHRTKEPIEEGALYGSDGLTYGKKALELWKETVPFRCRYRSPTNPNDPTKLTLKPHPVVQYMTNWLKRHGSLLVSEKIAREYAEMPLRQQREVRENLQAITDRVAALDEPKRQASQAKLDAQAKHMQETHDTLMQLAGHGVSHVVQQAQEYEFHTDLIIDDRNKDIEKLYEDIHELRQRNTQNAIELSRDESQLSDLERGTKQLEINANETRIAIKKMEKKNGKSGWKKTAMSIGIAVGVTCLTSGIGVSVTPINGGFSGGIIVPI